MERAIITVHLPPHRRQALQTYGESPRLVGQVYDHHIGEYVHFLERLGRECGFQVRSDNNDLDPTFTIDERSRDDKKAAKRWLDGLPDLWEWIT